MKPHRVLIAPDKFKGTLSSRQAAEAIARGLRAARPDWQPVVLPIADGGEGTVDALLSTHDHRRVSVPTLDALLRPRMAEIALVGDTAVFECASAVGLAHIPSAERDALHASSRGAGRLLRSCIEHGARRIFVGLGGSATNDGGLGLAAELGWRFLDAAGRDVEPIPARFRAIARVIRPGQLPAADIVGLCDVTNPLLGDQGASVVYGPQKGLADPIATDTALRRLADLVTAATGVDHRMRPGAGAAGGLGYGLLAFCAAQIVPGFDLIAEVVGFARAVRESDLVVTGEGRIDGQTQFGKGPAAVARLARRHGKPVIAFCGVAEGTDARGPLFDQVIPMVDERHALAEALLRPASVLEETARHYALSLPGVRQAPPVSTPYPE